MFDVNNLSEGDIIKQNERQTLMTVVDSEGRKYLKRIINEDKREVYKLLQKINNPAIPKIYHVSFEENTVVVEEYVDGKSLCQLMEEKTEFSRKQIKKVVGQILSALGELHRMNIIHRDIKPDNILVDERGNAHLVDFDIARVFRNEVRRDTETMGTFGYAPIEQFGMMPTDFKTDIYAFGVTLSVLLDYSKIKGKLAKVADRCKRLDPALRYKNVDEVKKAINNRGLIIGLIVVMAVAVGAGCFFATGISEKEETAVSNEQSEIVDSSEIDEKHENDIEKDDNAKDMQKEKQKVADNDPIRFVNIKINESAQESFKYQKMKNFVETSIFSGEGGWHYLPLVTDGAVKCDIMMGKQHKTPIETEFSFENGVLALSMKDEYGHSFERQFAYENNHNFEVLYPDNRRTTMELLCFDVDCDGVEELLIGMADCVILVEDEKVYPYFNYSVGWVVKYTEAGGFTLCKGDVFSGGSKFWLYPGSLGIHLPHFSQTAQNERIIKYLLLDDNSIVPNKI